MFRHRQIAGKLSVRVNPPFRRTTMCPFAGALLAVFLLCAGPGVARADPRDAIVAADMRAVAREIVDLYERHDLSWAHWIAWDIGSYTTTYWYFDPGEERIVAGDMPRDGEVDDYWATWSAVLTDGNWAPASFFRSQDEAREMARYNQFVLALHESAHAITYRYDPSHRERHDYSVNCREYYADRLTAAVLQNEADRDADMARWRQRYVELVTAMGATIPERYRVRAADYAAFEADCAVIGIKQPTPDSMQQYASAYFTRYAALLKVRLPELDSVFGAHLKGRRRAEASAFAPAPEWLGNRLETIGEIDAVIDPLLGRASVLAVRNAYRAVAFGADETLYAAEAAIDPGSGEVMVIFGLASGELARVETSGVWTVPPERIRLTSIAVFSPRMFLAAFEEGDDQVRIARFERNGQGWVATALPSRTGAATASVFRVGDGRLFIAYSRLANGARAETGKTWLVDDIDPQSGAVRASATVPVEAKHPVGADPHGRLYFFGSSLLVRAEREPDITRVAGNALAGNRDGDSETGEIDDIQIAQYQEDGSLLILDVKAGDPRRQLLRRLARDR